MIVAPMEPRAAIGEYDPAAEKWTLHSTSQGVHAMKTTLMGILGAPADKVRVITGQIGGSFGMKSAVYPEYICILHAARGAQAPGEMDRRALRQLRVRPARPRAGHGDRDRLRRERAYPRRSG